MEESVVVAAPPVPWKLKFSYGVGHILNDLCASMWFSYLLIFYHSVLEFSNNMAGLIMLLGQVADALCTPVIGIESDRTGFCGYGKRKSWHMIGTISVVISFPFLFMVCIGCHNSADWAKFIYYSPFVVIFQFGWAATQISHLALIPSITPCESARVSLNAIRYAATVMSNILVYCVAWILLSKDDDGNANLTPEDSKAFMILVLSVVGGGLIFSIIFHVGTKEETSTSAQLDDCARDRSKDIMIWKDWFREHQFYLVGVLYMLTRLIVNISQIYLPMYLTDSLKLEKHYIAIGPLVVFVSGFITSFLMKIVNKLIGRKPTYAAGCVLVVGACTWFYFLSESTQSLMVIGPAILLGAGTSTILVTSLSITADLIGDNCSSGAFVYGSMSFADKLSNGAAVVFIQFFHPCKTPVCCPACVSYYRSALSFIPGGISVLAFILILVLTPMKIGKLKKLNCMMINQDKDDESERRPLLDS